MVITAGSDDGLRMQESGAFTNNSGGTITFTNAGDEAIQLDNPSTFTNSGTVNIDNPADRGMELLGTFINNNIITVDDSGDVGLYILTQSTFTNNSSGTVTVTDATDHGIHIDANSNGSPATLSNYGAININVTGGITGDIDGLRMQEGAQLTNNSGGTITISGADDEAIQLDDPSTLKNNGTITITNAFNHGIEVRGTLNSRPLKTHFWW